MPRTTPRSGRSLLLTNISQLLTLASPSNLSSPRKGKALSELGIVRDAAMLCSGGRIVSVGRTKDALRDPWIQRHRRSIEEIDCGGKVVLPGFVDSHTHPAFAHPRLVDFEKRTAGATYEEIAAAGGGIRSSVASVRKATREELASHVLKALREMLLQGTTTVEAKSGYGLDLKSEIKSLEAIREASSRWPGTVVPTLLGAHVVPPEYKDCYPKYVELVCKKMVPAAAQRNLARFVDVFTERGAFSEEQTLQIFAAARQNGLDVRAHICQLSATRLKKMLAFAPASFDHMDYVNDHDIAALSKSNTVATLVPGANYFLNTGTFPPARKLIDSGVAVALATDYNPGSSPTPSMPMVASLACTHMKMTPAEAIASATVNGAWALRLQGRKGSVEPGKDADLAVFSVKDYREIAYWFASNHCEMVIANGEVCGG